MVMKACRARAKTAVDRPIRKTPTARTTTFGASTHTSSPTMLISAAPIIAVRSPMRDTSQPLGMSPMSSPTRMSEATNAEIAQRGARGRRSPPG